MQDYAKKLLELASYDESRALSATEALINGLKERGQLNQLPGILKDLRAQSARHAALAPVVEVGRKEDEQHALKAAEDLGIKAKHAGVNPSLIRGWRARANGMLVDRSGKRALIDLYRNVTR